MDIEDKKFLRTIAKDNDHNFVIVKAIEELNELSCALAQYLVKPVSSKEKQQRESIIEEMSHVEINLYVVKQMLKIDPKLIDLATKQKVLDLKRYKRELGSYYGKIRVYINPKK